MRISDWSSDVCSSDLCCGASGCRATRRRESCRVAVGRSDLAVDEGTKGYRSRASKLGYCRCMASGIGNLVREGERTALLVEIEHDQVQIDAATARKIDRFRNGRFCPVRADSDRYVRREDRREGDGGVRQCGVRG